MVGRAWVIALAISATPVSFLPLHGQDRPHQNLQVLPQDISSDELGDTMLGFLRSLGLPRRGGEGCLHCHTGDLDQPRSEWDWAADDKPAKRTARQMISMVRAINDEYLAGLQNRHAPDLEVGCATCHRGRVDPRPLPDVLSASYAAGGADSVATVYRSLHRRYFGSDAYDFRVSVLSGMAAGLAAVDEYDDALAISALNEETHRTDAVARRSTLGLMLQRTLDEEGPAATLRQFEQIRSQEARGVANYSLLDGLGWRTFRLDRPEDALPLFRANREVFPDLYFTFESLTEALYSAGETSLGEAMAAYEGWLEDHPGHEMAQVQLRNLQRIR